MRRLLLGLLALLVALGAAASLPHRASAHALRQSSVPDDGADLQQPPATVTITFGEAPDPRLSSIQVLSTGGQQFQGPTQAVPGNSLELQVALVKPLPTGVYTVSWRTVSKVDGHRSSSLDRQGLGHGARAGSGVQPRGPFERHSHPVQVLHRGRVERPIESCRVLPHAQGEPEKPQVPPRGRKDAVPTSHGARS